MAAMISLSTGSENLTENHLCSAYGLRYPPRQLDLTSPGGTFQLYPKKFQAKARHGGLWGSRYLSVQAHLCEMGPGHHFTADPAMKKLEQFHLVYISASCLCQLHFLWKFLLLWWVAGWFIKTVSWHHAQSPDSLTSPPQLKNRLQGCFVEKVISLKQNFFSSPGD